MNRRWKIFAGLVLLFVLALGLADVLLAAPLRGWAERTMNASLKGYSVRIARFRPHIWRLGFDLEDLVLAQDRHPDPPVGDFGALRFSLQLSELLRFKVVGDLIVDRPALHINLVQIEAETRSRVSLKERGWQRAVESIFPFKLNRVQVREGSLLYLSTRTESKPLRLTRLFLVANNIRNRAAVKGTYPSPVRLEAELFDTGRVRYTGTADFLREPHMAAQGELQLEGVPLDRLDPLAKNYQLETTGGRLSLRGSFEYTPEAKSAHLTEVLLDDLRVDYVTSDATRALELEHRQQAVKLAKSVRNAPNLVLRVDSLKLSKGQFGFVNAAVDPKYRLFVTNMNMELKDLSNQAGQGKSAFQASGSFMGSGAMLATGHVQSAASPAEFDVRFELKDAKLTSLNGFFLAHAGVDVAEGQFSVYTEVAVKNHRMDGYLKPLLKNLKIYEKEKDKDKPFGKRVKIHVLQFLASLFKNRTTQEVVTVIQLSGTTSDPQTSEWQAIRRLIGNGFSKAIRPGFLASPTVAKPGKPAPDRETAASP